MSNHQLMIEVGRHQGINKNRRYCPFCPESVKNEYHFLFVCPTYKGQRDIFLDPLVRRNPYFYNLDEAQKIEFIMSKVDYDLCYFIGNSFEIRKFLIDRPKRNEWTQEKKTDTTHFALWAFWIGLGTQFILSCYGIFILFDISVDI